MQKLTLRQRTAAVESARDGHAGEDLKVYGDEDNAISEAEGGVWVQAWIWVDDKEIRRRTRELSRKQPIQSR